MTNPDLHDSIEKATAAAENSVWQETAAARVRRDRTAMFQAALLGSVVAFAMLTFLVKTIPALDYDLQATRFLQTLNTPWFSALMQAISWPGFPPQSILLPVIAGLAIYLSGLKWEGVAAAMSAAVSGAVNQLVKVIIQRPRPTPDLVEVIEALDSFSFPSGHVMYYIVFFGFLWFLAFTILKPSAIRNALLLLVGFPVLLIGASRMYLGQHWLSDVLGAYLLGALLLAACIWFYRWGKKRFFVDQPVAPPEAGKTHG